MGKVFQRTKATTDQIVAAKQALDAARRYGSDLLRIELAEASLNDLLERYGREKSPTQ